MVFTFSNTKHSLLPGSLILILGAIPISSVVVQVYVIDEFHNVNVFSVQADGSGLVTISTGWFVSASSRFEVFVVYNNTVQTVTSTLDNTLSVDKILYYRKKGDFHCVAGTSVFVTGELPDNRIHSIYHSISYN